MHASWHDHDLDTQDCLTLAVTDEAKAPCMHLSRYNRGLHLQDCLALGVIFAATDSVAVLQVLKQDRSPLLYSLVFGEGVINDATAVALLRAVQVTTHSLHMPVQITYQLGSCLQSELYMYMAGFISCYQTHKHSCQHSTAHHSMA